MKKAITILMALALTITSALAFDLDKVEHFNGKGTLYVLRNADGEFITHAKIQIEQWENYSEPVFVVRGQDGRFMTWGFGTVECFDHSDYTEAKLVLRAKDGTFIAHTSTDPEYCE